VTVFVAGLSCFLFIYFFLIFSFFFLVFSFFAVAFLRQFFLFSHDIIKFAKDKLVRKQKGEVTDDSYQAPSQL